MENESILTNIKRLLGIEESCTDFDVPIKGGINNALFRLTQVGVGPSTGFQIADKFALWKEFVNNSMCISTIQNYVYLSTKLVFDPPLSSTAVDALNRSIEETMWSISIWTDIINTSLEEEDEFNAQPSGM